MTRTYTPADLEPILAIASQCGLILVGGQAVNIWCCLMEKPAEEPWASMRPYVSMDADTLGDAMQMMKLAKALEARGWKVTVAQPNKDEARINTGLLTIRGKISGRDSILEMNLLKHLEGLSNQEIRESAETIRLGKARITTLDPLRLLESKTISLNTLDQTNRQDKKHLRLCLALVETLLEETGKLPDPDRALAAARRIADNAVHPLGLDTLTRHGINLLDAIPWERWRKNNNPEIAGYTNQEAQLRQQMAQRIQDQKETQEWLDALKGKTKKPKPGPTGRSRL